MKAIAIKQHTTNRIHPQKFALWLGMASILMMFGAFTSAYIVKQAAGNWLEFGLPPMFYFSTATIICSSLTLHFAYRSFVKGNDLWYKNLLVVTFILGLTFVVLQYLGWTQLFEMGVDLKANPAGSFVYLITGMHALHVLGGVAALTVALIHAMMLPFKVTDKRKNRFQLVVQYWHFVDILWVYLLVFMIFNK